MAGGEYATILDPGVLEVVKEELARKEDQQKRHYFYLNELQTMAREQSGKIQQRLPYELLTSLANSLLDGTVFEIVHSLKEVQQLEERHLSSQRLKLINEQKAAKLEMIKRHRDEMQALAAKPHNIPFLEAQHKKESEAFVTKCDEDLKRRDMKIILELDQKVMEQQVTLEKAGVPGFQVTNNPQELKLQMYLLDFITKVAEKQPV